MTRRRYTAAEIDDYQLRPLRSETGEILAHDVLIAGDLLGRIRRSTRPRGWQATTATSTVPVRHAGTGSVARTREQAVIDLLIALDIHGK